MRNVKKILTLSLAGLALWGFASCKRVEPYTVEFDDYRCERLVKESEVRMYKVSKLHKVNKLVAKKIFKDDMPVYPLLDKDGFKFAEAKLYYEIVSLKKEDRYKPKDDELSPILKHLTERWGNYDIYGNLTVFGSVPETIPLWEGVIDGRDLSDNQKDFLDGKLNESWYEAKFLFIDFLKGEGLLEEKYDREF